ncbi:uncharacterized protein LOC131069298 [Cryptomeria japonica]|uniref:uncharacterized protein LOC131857998 n=1 Tax=Cryptomeria japonica TaxID=3369 RepID=UPI0027DA9A1D|nr:uncharacterized protein LOC131857998 [Cryptomeria japonica]XP_059066827.1 uncharacterized protein LOC131069298 [Cryptomeria japonica]
MSGQGKTTLSKAFCNLSLRNFYGKVCHLEFGGGNTLQRQKLTLRYLTQFPMRHIKSLTSEDSAHYIFNTFVKGQRVLLVLDSITDRDIDEVNNYLGTDMGKNSCILLSTRRLHVLENDFKIDSKSCMHVPRLEQEEAIAILWERKPSVELGFPTESRDFALKCAKKCLFKEERGFTPFHPLALKIFGRHLFSKQSKHLSKWAAGIDGAGDGSNDVFVVVDKAFNGIEYKCRAIFMLLTRYIPPNMSTQEAFMLLALSCNVGIGHIKKAVEDLYESGFIEEIEPEIRIHDLIKEFAQMNDKNKYYKLVPGAVCTKPDVSLLHPPSPRYHVKMWKTSRDELRGMDSSRFEWRNVDDKVCHLAFCGGLARENLALGRLTQLPNLQFEWVTSEEEARYFSNTIVEGQMVLLVLDNITEASINERRYYLRVKSEKGSCIPWIARSGDKKSCHFYPGSGEEAIAISLGRMSPQEALWAAHRGFASTRAIRRFFKKERVSSNIVEDISLLLPYSPRYRVPPMQGEARMCQEVKDFFNTVHPTEKGILIAGLYGMPGQGKTTLAKALCNINLRNFDGKVCHLEFCEGKTLQRQKHFLRDLAQIPMSHLESVTNEDDAQYFFNKFVKGQKVLLVLDNITEESIDEVAYYLRAELGENSCILLSARSVDLLVKHFNIDKQSCMSVPRLEEEEAIAILLERKPPVALGFPAESRDFALKCAKKCSIKDDTGFATFHPLALKAFGRHLFRKQTKLFSNWAAEIDEFVDGAGEYCSNGVFLVLDKAFDSMEYKCRTIFMLLTGRIPPNMSSKETFTWLALSCNAGIAHIKKAVVDLCENAFIEEIEPEIRIHELLKEFGQMNNKNKHGRLDEATPREKIAISRLLPPPTQRYPVPAMEGGARMCQEVAEFFNTVHPNESGVLIAGLYGMPGQGKTTLGKTFCNLNLWNFYGKVCHLEFRGGNKLGRQKLALQYLTHCSKAQLESFTREGEARKMLYERVRGQRVLLVLDNITEESIDEVKYYLWADLGENSCVLLSGRSAGVLAKTFNIDSESRMVIPALEEEEAIAILLERTSLAGSALGPENRGFALHCANRCSFKETSCDVVGATHKFHPLALKFFGQHLFNKYGIDLSQWVAEADGLVFGSCDGLDDVFIVLDKVLDYMDPKHRTIFMLLSIYLVSIMSPLEVTEWLAITCREEIEYIEKAVEDLWQKGFLEEIEPEIHIHNLHMEFARSKARKMKRWVWCKRDLATSEAGAGLFSEDEAGFELVNLDYYEHLDLSAIGDKYVKNLWALQVVDRTKEISATLHNYEYLEISGGIENLPYVALLQVPDLKVLNLSSLNALQYLYIEIGYGGGITGLGDLTGCVSLREIYVRCRSLSEFPGINGLLYLEKASFKRCDDVMGPLNCSNCLKLRSIVIKYCSQMAHIPLIVNCSCLHKIVLKRCDAITEYSDENDSSALEILQLCISSEDASGPRHPECCDGFKNPPLWNIVISRDVPSLRRLSNLTVLKLYKCDISEPPDVTCCSMLEDVYLFQLKFLESFPSFSSLRKLKKLCLCDCQRVRAPPEIGGCQGLQVFHLLYNDNMEELPQMDACPQLEELKLSWHSEEAVDPRHEILESCKDDSHSYEDEDLYSSWNEDHESFSDEDDDLEFSPDYQKDEIFSNINHVFLPVGLKEWQWIQDKTVRVKQYSRGGKQYYSVTAPYVSDYGSRAWEQAPNGDSLEQVIIPTESAISG